MAIRGLLWLALLFVAAVAFALVGHFDTGQVLIIYDARRIDIALNFFVIALVVGFIVLYILLRALGNLWKMPGRVAAYRARSRVTRSQKALRDALGFLFAGRFSRAEKAARDAGALDLNQAAAALIGASAAHRMHEYTRRDEWLAQIRSRDWQEARLMATADMRVDAHDADGALAALAESESQGARRLHAQQIALRSHRQLNHWADVRKLVRALEKRDAIHPAAATQLHELAAENLLRDRRHNADALLELWRTLGAPERHAPRIADLAAELLVALDRPSDARKIVEEALAQNWDARLLRRYADCAGDDARPLIQRAEAWQQDRTEDPDLLFALGRLCLQQKLWGKAQAFLERALRLADNEPLRIRAHRTLARLHEELGNGGKAAEHYRASAMAMNVV